MAGGNKNRAIVVLFWHGTIDLFYRRVDISFAGKDGHRIPVGYYTTLVRVVGVLIGVHWGLMGVAWAYVLGTYVFICYPTWSKAGRLLNQVRGTA